VVQKWIASGQVRKHDLGCRDLVEGWQPLGKLLWPEEFSKAGTFSGKQWIWIVAAIVGMILFGLVVDSSKNNSNSTSASNSGQQVTNERSHNGINHLQHKHNDLTNATKVFAPA